MRSSPTRPQQCSEELGEVVEEMEGKKCEQETNDAMGDNEINGFEDEEQVTVTEAKDQEEATSNSTRESCPISKPTIPPRGLRTQMLANFLSIMVSSRSSRKGEGRASQSW